MRPEGVRKALLESEGRPSIVHLNDGSRLRVRSREHWMIGDEFLFLLIAGNLHYVAFRNIASIEVRSRKSSRSRPA